MENFKLNTKKHIGRKQVILDCKFNIENGKEVEQILSVNSTPIILTSTCHEKNLTYGGKLDTTLLYSTPNGEKVSLIAVADFNEIFEDSEINENSVAEIECKLIDITTPSIKSNEVKVACIVDINICLISIKDIDIKCECDNILSKEKYSSITKHLKSINENFEFSEEIKIEDTLNQILKIDSCFAIKDCYCANDFFVIEGNCLMNIVYEDENNFIKQFKTQLPFKQEIECQGATSECFTSITISPLCYLSKTVVTQENGYNLIKYQLPIQVCGNIYATEDIICLEDAYSSSHLIKCNHENIPGLKNIKNYFFEDTVKGNVKVSTSENINILAFLNSNCEIANQILDKDNLSIEGIISTTILYEEKTENYDDENLIATTKTLPIIAEFGFNSNFKIEDIVNIQNLTLKCNIVDIDINFKNGEFEIIAKISFWINNCEEEVFHLLTSIETISARTPSNSAIDIFFSEKDQDLWELAKEIGLSEEEILKQNPHLKSFVESGTKIIIYHQIHCN